MASQSISLPHTAFALYSDLGACIDHNAQVLLAQKLLSKLARDAGGGQKDAPQRQQPGNESAGSARAVDRT